jgi:hypothetical protein
VQPGPANNSTSRLLPGDWFGVSGTTGARDSRGRLGGGSEQDHGARRVSPGGGGARQGARGGKLTRLVIIEEAESLDDLLHGVTLRHLRERENAWRALSRRTIKRVRRASGRHCRA